MVPKHNDARFSSKGKKILVLFNGQDAHGGDGLRSSFLSKSTILAESDFANMCCENMWLSYFA